MFKLSYWYTVVIAFTVTFIVGILMSILLKTFYHHETDRIYIDGNKHLINYDLFMEPIAKKLKREHHKREKLISHFDVSSIPKMFLNHFHTFNLRLRK